MSKFAKFMRGFKSMYTSKYAVVTNTFTSGTMTLAEDVLCQRMEMKSSDKPFDIVRTKGMIFATVVLAPGAHYWYGFLDSKFPGKSVASILRKIALDVSVSPIYFSMFTSCLCFAKGMSAREIKRELINKIPILFVMDVIFWSTLQAFNFALLPPHYRIIGVKFNEFFLGIILSHLLNNDYTVAELMDEVMEKVEEHKHLGYIGMARHMIFGERCEEKKKVSKVQMLKDKILGKKVDDVCPKDMKKIGECDDKDK